MTYVGDDGVTKSLKAGDFYTEKFYNGSAINPDRNWDGSTGEFTVTLVAIDRRPILS